MIHSIFWGNHLLVMSHSGSSFPTLSFSEGNQLLAYSKTCLKGPLKIDKTRVLKTNSNLVKIESIAECSPRSILQYMYFWSALSDSWYWNPILVFFLSGRLRQVLLYLYLKNHFFLGKLLSETFFPGKSYSVISFFGANQFYWHLHFWEIFLLVLLVQSQVISK